MSRYDSIDEFIDSLNLSEPPEELNNLLQALWFDAKGDWESAHDLAQAVYTPEGAWVHAYLHRKEGDKDNAAYWYGKALRKFPEYSFEEEWRKMVDEFLG
ncbi:MAG: hypothetical protein HC906_04270 [Bacteroidales bacterium]|nr:hypothetical protein [Bacteroidales bacterium]